MSCIVFFFCFFFFFCFICFFFVLFVFLFLAVVSLFVMPVLVTYEYVHDGYFNCSPASGLGSVYALTLTHSLLIVVLSVS